MIRSARLLVGAAAVFFLVSGPLEGLGSAAPAAGKVYTQAASGDTVRAMKGRTFEVRLVNYGDGGYTWAFAKHPDSAVLRVISSKITTDPQPGGGRPLGGAPEHRTWVFRVVGDGNTSFTLAEHPPGRRTVEKRFTLTVKVS
jgi:predicted secreted protein